MKLDDFIVGWSGGRITKRPVELVDLWEDVCEAAWNAVGSYLEDLDSFFVRFDDASDAGWWWCEFTLGEHWLAVSYIDSDALVAAVPEVLKQFRPLRELMANDYESWMRDE